MVVCADHTHNPAGPWGLHIANCHSLPHETGLARHEEGVVLLSLLPLFQLHQHQWVAYQRPLRLRQLQLLCLLQRVLQVELGPCRGGRREGRGGEGRGGGGEGEGRKEGEEEER